MTASGWNLVLYAIARDAEEHRDATDAIAQMRAAAGESCNIAVQLHERGKTTRHWISRSRKIEPETETLPVPADASEPASLTSFLNTTHRRLPDLPTALVLWAHSSGLDHLHDYPKKKPAQTSVIQRLFEARAPVVLGGAPDPGEVFGKGPVLGAPPGLLYGAGREAPGPRRPERYGCRWGPDPGTGNYLTNVGMKKAIAGSNRHRVELLALNACWMASLEIEYELRGVADVQVASQVSATPWPYGAIVAAMTAAPDLTAERLGRRIVACVQDEIAAGKRLDTVSALASGRYLDELAAAFDRYARRALALIDLDWEGVSKAVMKEAQRVDDPYQVDLMSLVRVLGKNDVRAKIAAAAVETSFHAMRLAHTAHPGHPGVHGLSIFCPKTTHVDLNEAYRGTDFRSNAWAQFLKAFQIRLPRLPTATA